MAMTQDGGVRQVHLSSALLAEESTFWKRPLFAIMLTRAIRFVADSGHASEQEIRQLFADRVDDEVLSVERDRFSLSASIAQPAPAADTFAGGGRAMPELLQWIMLAVLVAVGIECWLLVKGRIV